MTRPTPNYVECLRLVRDAGYELADDELDALILSRIPQAVIDKGVPNVLDAMWKLGDPDYFADRPLGRRMVALVVTRTIRISVENGNTSHAEMVRDIPPLAGTADELLKFSELVVEIGLIHEGGEPDEDASNRLDVWLACWRGWPWPIPN